MNTIKPILNVDCPDPDVIRVGDTFYMVSTSMFFFPGCEILKSKDLVNWEHASYVYDMLEGTKAQRLIDGNIYSAGMWAASLRYHEGIYYICFVANDTQKTYLFRSLSIEGPWTESEIEGFYHDCSLLFDEGRIFIAYGNREIYITELKDDLSGPKPGGLHKMVVKDRLKNALGYEGTHFYKINGFYYLFFIHSVEGKWFRTQACYRSETIDGEYVGREVFADDNGYRNAGIAQGAIVETEDNKWYAVLFQDRGGSGRIPYLIPMSWSDNWPIIGNNGKLVPVIYDEKKTEDDNLVGSDDFTVIYDRDSCYGFSNKWQFNHEPDISLIKRRVYEGAYELKSDKICTNPTQARNSLTQRMREPACEAVITIDASGLKNGDYAGMTALQYLYGFIGIRADEEGYSIVYMSKPDKNSPDVVKDIAVSKSNKVKFKIKAEFGADEDRAYFAYDDGRGFIDIDDYIDMPFMLEFFTGYRFALTYFATKETGGSAVFSNFIYQ